MDTANRFALQSTPPPPNQGGKRGCIWAKRLDSLRGTALVCCLLAALVGCGKKEGPAVPERGGGDRLRVAVSILPQRYFVERLGGERVSVQVLIPPGASPETHEPTVGQIEGLSNADVYVKLGCPDFPFEKTWFSKLEEANRAMRVVDMSAGVPLLENNPHIWLSIPRVRVEAANIRAGLAAADPEHREEYEASERMFLKELDLLDAEIRRTFAHTTHRSFIVYHPAWLYFARDYGLEEIAIEEEGKEPGAAALQAATDRAKSLSITVIHVQPQFDKKNARIVADAIGGKVVELDPLALDWPDNMQHVAKTLAEGMR